MREIVRASAWGGFRELVAELGGDPDAIFAAAQVDPAALDDPERYMPLKAFIDCQAIAAKRLKRPDFGLLLGGRQTLQVLGALSIAILNSPTARQGIEIAARYMHVHDPAFVMTLTPMPRTTREFLSLAVELRRQTGREQNDERILASVHKSLGALGDGSYRPRDVWFLHEPISPLAVYRRVFGIAPQFGMPVMGISIERKVLDAWRPGNSPQLRQIAETYLQAQSPPRDKSFTVRVATMARGLLRGRECTPEQTAKALGVHPRTLQRRLRAEGTSFEKIKDDVRREWAESLLVQPSVSLSQIALMLDYADSSAFSRSCRRWFGEAPRTYRAQLLAARSPAPRPKGSRVKSYDARQLAKSTRG
ncbi:MAG TPA: AraC family transcriptional regulator [Hyphomonadaceae bacterium]|nr:AraC family transcriptional regulator [Hyphomonadaceae bacterium]